MNKNQLQNLVTDLKQKTKLSENNTFEQCMFHATEVAHIVNLIETTLEALKEQYHYAAYKLIQLAKSNKDLGGREALDYWDDHRPKKDHL